MANTPEHEPHGTHQSKKAAASGWIGSALEDYDFFTYATAAALIFPQLFFPSGNPTIAIVASLATYGVGYVARPIGAFVLGHWGDTHGRKRVLLLCMFVMGFSTMAVGFLPTYQQVGVLAPVLLVVLRLIQGFAVAGEISGASSMILEHAPFGQPADPLGPRVAEQAIGKEAQLVRRHSRSDLQSHALGTEAGLLQSDLVGARQRIDMNRASQRAGLRQRNEPEVARAAAACRHRYVLVAAPDRPGTGNARVRCLQGFERLGSRAARLERRNCRRCPVVATADPEMVMAASQHLLLVFRNAGLGRLQRRIARIIGPLSIRRFAERPRGRCNRVGTPIKRSP